MGLFLRPGNCPELNVSRILGKGPDRRAILGIILPFASAGVISNLELPLAS